MQAIQAGRSDRPFRQAAITGRLIRPGGILFKIYKWGCYETTRIAVYQQTQENDRVLRPPPGCSRVLPYFPGGNIQSLGAGRTANAAGEEWRLLEDRDPDVAAREVLL